MDKVESSDILISLNERTWPSVKAFRPRAIFSAVSCNIPVFRLTPPTAGITPIKGSLKAWETFKVASSTQTYPFSVRGVDCEAEADAIFPNLLVPS